MPGIVISFDSTKQEVSVQPVVLREFVETKDNTTEEVTVVPLPVLEDVPIVVMQGGTFFITHPILPGDECIIMFQQRDMDLWYTTGLQNKANSFRQHDFSDAVALVGLNSIPRKITNYNSNHMEVRDFTGTTKLRITKAGTLHIDAITHIDIICPGTMSVDVPETLWTGNITQIGDYFETGTYTHLGDKIHTGNTTHIGTTTQTGAFNIVGSIGLTGPITAVAAAPGGFAVFDSKMYVSGDMFSDGDVIQTVGSVLATVAVNVGSIGLTFHTHTGVTSGPNNTGPPV